MKTVIQVYTNKVCNINYDENNIETYWGFGDVLRGIINLHTLSLKYNFDLIIDIQHHPISKYLKFEKHKYFDMVTQNKDNIFLVRKTLDFLSQNEDKDVILLLSIESVSNENITKDTKDFIKKFLTPNEEFEKYIKSKKKIMPFFHYNILHFRLGDDLELNKIKKNSKFSHLLPLIKKYNEKNDILISDSNKFKKFVSIYHKIFFFNSKIVHMGIVDNDTELQDTLLEFFLLSSADRIKTYNVYGWVSNFVLWVSIIYDIPLVKIEL